MEILHLVQSAKYLGLTITDNLDWGQHVSEISCKATKTMGFLQRNLALAPRHTKEVAYKTLVRPQLEYAAPIWNPYHKLQIQEVEKVQRTAARWTCRRWRNTSSVVGDMLDELEWPSLEARREQSSLTFFYKIHSRTVSLDKDKYLTRHQICIEQGHLMTYSTLDILPIVMPLRIPSFPELFHCGIVFLLRWSPPRPLRSLKVSFRLLVQRYVF